MSKSVNIEIHSENEGFDYYYNKKDSTIKSEGSMPEAKS